MDLHYIVLNSIVYGSIATVLAAFFALGKYLHLAIGAYLTAAAYIIYSFLHYGFSAQSIVALLTLVCIFLVTNWLLLSYFPYAKQRDHVGIVFTLGLSIVLENMIQYVFGPTAISLSLVSFPSRLLVCLFSFLVGFCWYMLGHTFRGMILKGIWERSTVIQGLGVRLVKLLHRVFSICLLLLFVCAFMVLNESSLRASDGLFYMIKGIGIMILVGLSKKEYMYIGALLYVLVEYLLFVQVGLPISYKETLIIVVIVLVLLLRPEGLFSILKRRI